MSQPGPRDWDAQNQAYLAAALDRVQAALESRRARRSQPEQLGPEWQQPPALEQLVALFGLSAFERDLLLLCAGMELDSGFAAACRRAAGGRQGPTFSVALAALEDAHWSALAPTAPLRYWRLLELQPADGLANAPLRIDERVLHYLTGVTYPDERLHGLAQPWVEPAELPASHRILAEQIAGLWSDGSGRWTPVQLCGEEDAGLEDVAAAAFSLRGLALNVLRAADLPLAAGDRDLICRLWDREAVLANSGLLVLVDDADPPETLRAAAAFVDRAQCVPLVGGREPLRLAGRSLPRVDVHKPDSAEQAELWRLAVPDGGERLGGHIDQLVNQFHMGRSAILTASAMVRRAGSPDADAMAELMWETCREQARVRLDDLAERVTAQAGWDDLVLPDLQMQILRELVVHVRQRVQVYDHWGFADRSTRGLGVSALFSGPSGTGKTLAAEILANELRLDLYRIDLSQVVSKYIGETEKNLRRVFDAAETAGAVLLFDEADALFGKRSEVKDSHDRYANIEVSYLLQRMEAYRGLAILTTNLKQALDPAFTRRIRFMVPFPFPDGGQRAEIWRRVFPAATPTAELEPRQLSQLNVAGGNIRNIALSAAFLAADEAAPVGMAHVLRAARGEYAKLDRPLTDAEIAGWQ
jgi:ATPase family associated with various cellular activities (AAA)